MIAATRASNVLAPNAKSVLHALLGLDGQRGAAAGTAYSTHRELAELAGVSYITACRMVERLDVEWCVFQRRDRVYPKQMLPCGRRSVDGCTVFHFDYQAMLALAPVAPLTREDFETAPSKPVLDRVRELEDLLDAQREVFEEQISELRARLEKLGHREDTNMTTKGHTPISGSTITGRLSAEETTQIRTATERGGWREAA